MKIRSAQKSDFLQISRLWEYSFNFSKPFLQWSLGNILQKNNIYIADDNGDAAAVLGSKMSFIENSGKSLRASYLFGCATAPEYRRMGIMTNLIKTHLQQLHNANVPLCLCIPFNYKVLESMGWRTSYMYKQYTLSPDSIPPYTVGGRIKICDISEKTISILSEIYSKFTSDKNGYIKRSTNDWNLILSDLTLNFGGRCAVFYDKNNIPKSYMLYLVNGDKMNIYELAYIDKASCNSMYAFMRNHSSQVKEIIVKVSENDLMQLDFCDSRNSVSLCPFVAARIASVNAALSELCIRVTNDVKIKVIDRFLEDNNATYKITQNGVFKTDDEPDVITDVGTLTQLFMGYISVDEALFMNMLAGKADTIRPLFRKARENYINMLIL